jgi:hypothetical protein
MTARLADPVGSFGASVGSDQRETGVLAFHRRVYRGGRGVRSDTEIGPMLPRGLFGPSHGGAPRRVGMRRHSPGRTVLGLDARAQALLRTAMPGRWVSMFAMVMVVSINFVHGRLPTQPRMDGSGPRAGNASIAYPQRLRRLFSPAAKGRHSSRDKKAVCRRPPLALRA